MDTSLENFVLPVDELALIVAVDTCLRDAEFVEEAGQRIGTVRIFVPDRLAEVAFIASSHVVDPILTRVGFGIGGQAVETHVGIEIDADLALGSLLGGDDDDTVGTCRTIDGGRGGILEHLDALDVVGVEVGDGAAAHTVDDEERCIRTVERTVTTQQEGGRLACLARLAGDVETGNLALQTFHGVHYRCYLDFVGLHARNSAGEIALLLDTITDHHHFFEEVVVFVNDDFKLGIALDGHVLSRISHKTDVKDRLVGHTGDGEVAIEVGDGARCGAFDENIGTDDGFAGGLVNHLTGHGSGLCEKKASAQHKCEQKCKDSNKWHTDALLVEHVEVFFIG